MRFVGAGDSSWLALGSCFFEQDSREEGDDENGTETGSHGHSSFAGAASDGQKSEFSSTVASASVSAEATAASCAS
jgi:hypothetical protein